MKKNYNDVTTGKESSFMTKEVTTKSPETTSGLQKVMFLMLLVLLLMSNQSMIAQQLIPAAQGGFESGTSTFAANGWTEVQTQNTRRMFVGTAAGGHAGTKAAYAGGAAGYTGINNAVVSHFYKDVAIPLLGAGQTATLSFWYKMPTVDSGYDYLDVMYTTTANTPVANVFAQYTNLLSNTSSSVANWTQVSANLSSLAGTTVRIVVSFESDGVSPHANPALDDFSLLVATPLPPTQCATLVSPANAATNVTNFTLSWTAPASGPVASSYDVYLSTAANPTFFGNVTTTSITITGYAINTTYYWKIIPKSATGSDATGCTIRSLTTGNPFLPYCYSGVTYTNTNGIEPITLVNFAGINRSSVNTVTTTSPALENYIADIANVTTASSYNITLKGNTNGAFTNWFTVFIDWNQDGDMSDPGEIYPAGSVNTSTGLDAKQAVTSIAIPETALPGTTRMRVKKIYGVASNLNPCTGAGFGQSEDYTVNVTACAPTFTWYADADGDTFGNAAVTLIRCVQPAGYVANNTDCNDADNTKNTTFQFYVDADGDTYGTGSLVSVCAVNATTPPANYSMNNTDCNDNNAAVYQSGTLYTDADGDGYDVGNSVVCYGASVPAGMSLTTLGTDCNDSNAAIYQMTTYYVDADGDGYDNGSASVCSGASAPAGYSPTTLGSDCNDTNPAIYQMATYYVDADGDGYDNGSASVCSGATAPAGYSASTLGSDCDDSNTAIYQSATLYTDVDGDGYDVGNSVVCYGATIPAGYSTSTLGSDCDDTDSSIYQNATLYTDVDGDGYDAGNSVVCYGATIPVGYSLTTNGSDCNDNDASMHQTYAFFADADGDGYGAGSASQQCAANATTAPAGYSVNNTDCDDNIAAVNPGASETLYDGVDNNCNNQLDEGFQLKTKLLPEVCGETLASINSLIGITTVSSAITMYRIRVTNGAQVQIIERNVPHFTLTALPSYQYATTYSVEIMLQRNGVWLGYYGDSCLVSSPAVLAEGGATQVSPSQCGITLPRINTLIATTSLQGVTGYRFRVTNITAGASGPNVIQSIDRANHWFSLPMLTQYNYGSTYRVEVAVKTNGSYSGYGAPCEVSSPASPSLINCGGVVASPNSLVAATSTQGVTQYRFQIIRVSDGATNTIDRNTNYFTFSMVPAYTPAAQYNVRVAVMTVGTWSPFGDICEITSPGSATRFSPDTTSSAPVEFKVTAYPNPFASTFAIDATGSAVSNLQISVYDMTGRLIETREVSASTIYDLKIGDRLPSGVYNVIVTQDQNIETLRVIKR